MATDRGVRAQVGTGLLAVGVTTAGIVWQARTDYSRHPAFWISLVVAGIGAGILLSLLFDRRSERPPGWFQLWWRQRRYEASSDAADGGGWPERLSLKRHAVGEASFTCEVDGPGDQVFKTELRAADEEVAILFPNGFVGTKPIRPPPLPEGIYEVAWRIEERGRRLPAIRTVYSRFTAEDRPRWEWVHAELLPEDKGSVRLVWDGAPRFSLRCRVRHIATGKEYTLTQGGGFEVDGGVAALFPDTFSGTKPPDAGLYEATWLAPPTSWYGDEEDHLVPIVVHEFDYVPQPTWESRVLGITRTEHDLRLFTIRLSLETPDGNPSEQAVSAELVVPDGRTLGPVEAMWNDHNLHPGEPPHYVLFYPSPSFGVADNDPIDNGEYEVRWREAYGVSWRYLTGPHDFELRHGEIVTDE